MANMLKAFKSDNIAMSTPDRQSMGILDDFAIRKVINTQEGTIEKVPVNNSDIVNKKYVDGLVGGGEQWHLSGSTLIPNTAGAGISVGQISGASLLNISGSNLVVLGNGNVGIGMTPVFKLDVDGAARVNGLINSGGTYISGAIYDASANTAWVTINAAYIGFSINSAERMRITPGGYVGIGTTGPLGKLHIENALTDGTAQEMFRASHDGSWALKLIQNFSGAGNMQYDWYQREAGVDLQVLTFKHGNVGIGTTAPLSKLTISGTAGTYEPQSISFKTEVNPQAGSTYASGAIQSGFTSQSYSGAYLDLQYPTGTDTYVTGLRLMNGNVGIGTTSPSGKLHISGGSLYISNTTAPATPSGAGALFISGGALFYIGSSGTQTQLAAA